MQYLEFQKYFSSYSVFSINEIEKIFPDFNKINLLTWQKKGYITKLRNGFYKLNNTQNTELDLFIIANKIYSPSYVSLESALSFYEIIPEALFSVTSVTTLKTNTFKNKEGNFIYKNLKPNLLFGYQLLQTGDNTYKIAELEKTILDYLYLKKTIKTMEDIKSLRFNRFILKEKLNLKKLYDYAYVFDSKSLLKKVMAFNKLLDA